ncbi:hypothetical protein [Paraburkholderia flava]|uniref:hypothetical protein n=1 Tax=Paraburkholderia flava TaxID=2547393 RepID=UPI00105FF60C|nr:hypothetical protein [Paraburkholderia flava]
MDEQPREHYKGCQIRACAQIDARAADGLELGVLYQPIAVIEWCDSAGTHRKLLCDRKGRIFNCPEDALRLAAAMAKRFVDTTLAGVGAVQVQTQAQEKR